MALVALLALVGVSLPPPDFLKTRLFRRHGLH
jgi:hypothetical protein